MEKVFGVQFVDAGPCGCRTDADGDRQRLFAGVVRDGDRRALAFPANFLGHAPGADLIGLRQEQAELFTADARQHVRGADARRPAVRHFAQDLVADVVAVGVVNRLEVVDVEHGNGQRLPVLARAGQGLGGKMLEGATVGQERERVGVGFVVEALVDAGQFFAQGALAVEPFGELDGFGDVAVESDVAGDVPPGVEVRNDGGADPENPAVLVQVAEGALPDLARGENLPQCTKELRVVEVGIEDAVFLPDEFLQAVARRLQERRVGGDDPAFRVRFAHHQVGADGRGLVDQFGDRVLVAQVAAVEGDAQGQGQQVFQGFHFYLLFI